MKRYILRRKAVNENAKNNRLSPNEQYDVNKNAKCGETIICPVCGTTTIKKHYQQAFCSNECKNKFWNKKGDRHKSEYYYRKYNMLHPERYNYLIANARNADEARHWEAIKAYAEDKGFREYVRDCELNSDGAWDEHDCYVAIEDLYDNYLGLYDENNYDENDFIDEHMNEMKNASSIPDGTWIYASMRIGDGFSRIYHNVLIHTARDYNDMEYVHKTFPLFSGYKYLEDVNFLFDINALSVVNVDKDRIFLNSLYSWHIVPGNIAKTLAAEMKKWNEDTIKRNKIGGMFCTTLESAGRKVESMPPKK